MTPTDTRFFFRSSSLGFWSGLSLFDEEEGSEKTNETRGGGWFPFTIRIRPVSTEIGFGGEDEYFQTGGLELISWRADAERSKSEEEPRMWGIWHVDSNFSQLRESRLCTKEFFQLWQLDFVNSGILRSPSAICLIDGLWQSHRIIGHREMYMEVRDVYKGGLDGGRSLFYC